jgi:hypothetical protein
MTAWLKKGTQPGRRATAAALLSAAGLVLVGSLAITFDQGGPGSVRAGQTVSKPASALFASLIRHLPRGPGTARKVLTLADADGLPQDCLPELSGPPAYPYQLGLVGHVKGGVLIAGPATVSNINVTFCGVVTVVNATAPCGGATGYVSSQPDDQVFGPPPLSVALNLVPGMSPNIGFTANPGTITGTFNCGSGSNGLTVSLVATVSGSTAPLFGVSCTIGPLTIPLTGTVTGPFTNLTTTLTSNDFTVPALQPSPTCSGGIPANVDAIVGLPIPPGGASASLPVTASLYLPAP